MSKANNSSTAPGGCTGVAVDKIQVDGSQIVLDVLELPDADNIDISFGNCPADTSAPAVGISVSTFDVHRLPRPLRDGRFGVPLINTPQGTDPPCRLSNICSDAHPPEVDRARTASEGLWAKHAAPRLLSEA